LLNLPEEAQHAIIDRMLNGNTYLQVKDYILEKYQIETSAAALSKFWETMAAPVLLARRHRAVETADEIADEAIARPGKFDAATIDALKQKAFELAIAPGADPRDVKSLFMLVLKARDQEIDAQTLALESEKFRATIASKVEAGLDAIHAEIKGNAKALALFQQMRDAVRKGIAA
jgi:hypothetical protein